MEVKVWLEVGIEKVIYLVQVMSYRCNIKSNFHQSGLHLQGTDANTCFIKMPQDICTSSTTQTPKLILIKVFYSVHYTTLPLSPVFKSRKHRGRERQSSS